MSIRATRADGPTTALRDLLDTLWGEPLHGAACTSHPPQWWDADPDQTPGRPGRLESGDQRRARHRRAKAVCGPCPAITACRARRFSFPALPGGIWAGELWAEGATDPTPEAGEDRTCARCGQTFRTTHPTRRDCGLCQQADHRPTAPDPHIPCKTCSGPIPPRRARRGAITCGDRCRIARGVTRARNGDTTPKRSLSLTHCQWPQCGRALTDAQRAQGRRNCSEQCAVQAAVARRTARNRAARAARERQAIA